MQIIHIRGKAALKRKILSSAAVADEIIQPLGQRGFDLHLSFDLILHIAEARIAHRAGKADNCSGADVYFRGKSLQRAEGYIVRMLPDIVRNGLLRVSHIVIFFVYLTVKQHPFPTLFHNNSILTIIARLVKLVKP